MSGLREIYDKKAEEEAYWRQQAKNETIKRMMEKLNKYDDDTRRLLEVIYDEFKRY
jgi:hypothetical protein